MTQPLQAFVGAHQFFVATGPAVRLTKKLSTCTARKCSRRLSGVSSVQAAQTPQDKGPSGSGYRSSDDEKLQSELNDKIRELFGGSENISIKVDEEDTAEFRIRRGPDGANLQGYRQAWVTVSSIVTLSAIAGILFTYLYYTGAVHGSPSPNRNYDMPSYNSRSYIDPYELLDAELGNQE